MLIKQEDSYRHKGLRERLIQEVASKGITNQEVLKAMGNIPRHFFLDPAFDKIAYEDRAFPIGEDQTISQPYTVAYQTDLLQVKPLDKILEIGTGSVYQSCVLAELGAKVYTIERVKALYRRTQLSFPLKDKYKEQIKFFFGDGFLGLPGYAPFDKILITAAAPFVPERLVQQLKPGGVMVLPLGESESKQTMTRLTKQIDGSYSSESFSDFIFVPMLKGKAN